MAPPGWDGDDLAGQMEDTVEREQTFAEERAERENLTSTESARRVGEESLRLSHARTIEQLQRATNPTHRTMLERALRSLEAQINK
ncbi:MAG: hypothetical protein M3R15_16340 [Acidobacteriota bacterium]|nr:hypothetical protein [Acidobacteriota bacterium]